MSRPGFPHTQLHVDQLEAREVMSANVLFNAYTGAVTIDGTQYADDAKISYDDTHVKAEMTYNGTRIARWYNAAQVKSVTFHGFEGSDIFSNTTCLQGVVYGGAGSDILVAGCGNDSVYGGTGNDTLVGNSGNDIVLGLGGADVLYGKNGSDYLYGGSESDTIMDATSQDVSSQDKAGVGAWIYTVEEYVISSKISAVEREIVNFTNMERSKAGLAPLKISVKLTDAAQYHAVNMAKAGQMSHQLAGEEDLGGRFYKFGYTFRAGAENIAVNYSDAKSVVAGWMNSPSHKANILDSYFTEIGVGVRSSSSNQPYYCQNFGTPG